MDQDFAPPQPMPNQRTETASCNRKTTQTRELSHEDWIKSRIFTLLSFYYLPNDKELARMQAAEWVKILRGFSSEEIDIAASAYLAEEPDRKPNPGHIRQIIMRYRLHRQAQAEMNEPRLVSEPFRPCSSLDAEGRQKHAQNCFKEIGFHPNRPTPRMPSLKDLGHG